MAASRFRAVFLSALFCVATNASGVDFAKKDFRPFGYHSQEHFWLSAGGTFIGSQTLQVLGMARTPANFVSAGAIFGLGMSKEFILDHQPGVNDIIVDTLGAALGTFANITIHFDYWGKKGKKTDGASRRKSELSSEDTPLPAAAKY